MRPFLTVICPTIGRATLHRTIASIRDQAPADQVEIIVVGDSHAGTYRDALDQLGDLCPGYEARYIEHDGGSHCWGQQQRNHGQEIATGQWLWWLQDDDIAAVGAISAIRKVTDRLTGTGKQRPCPVLFKVHQHHGGRTIWETQEIKRGNVDADCIVAPNQPVNLGHWRPEYAGDLAFIHDTVCRFQGFWWRDAIIAEARP